MNPVHTSQLTSLPLLARGKVRDNYAVGSDRILMVASDRLSAFDVVIQEPIPGKGELLTRMALFWFERLKDIVPNHLTGEDPLSVVQDDERQQQRRALLEFDLVKKNAGKEKRQVVDELVKPAADLEQIWTDLTDNEVVKQHESEARSADHRPTSASTRAAWRARSSTRKRSAA